MAGSLKDMRLFVAAYEELSFTAAAEREHATQSGVSQHIRNLEDTFGVKLFLRDKGKVSACPAGDTYYRHCIEVLRSHDAASRSVKHFAGGVTGEIAIGLMPTMTRCTLTPALVAFLKQNPNTNIHILEGNSVTLTQMVRAGELDLAIVPSCSETNGLRSQMLIRTSEMLVVSRSWGLSHLQPVRLADLEPLKLVLPSKGNTRRQTLESYFAANQITVDRLIDLDTMFGTLDFVTRIGWATILPAIMMGHGSDALGLTVHPIVSPQLTLDLMLIEPSRKHMSEAAEIFLDLLCEAANALNGPWIAEEVAAAE